MNFDLRTRVFDQRPAVARRVLHADADRVPGVELNSDVVGAQQAFTSTLSSVVSNVISLVLVLGTMFLLS
jgi:ATP-binding cassette subfamily B protein